MERGSRERTGVKRCPRFPRFPRAETRSPRWLPQKEALLWAGLSAGSWTGNKRIKSVSKTVQVPCLKRYVYHRSRGSDRGWSRNEESLSWKTHHWCCSSLTPLVSMATLPARHSLQPIWLQGRHKDVDTHTECTHTLKGRFQSLNGIPELIYRDGGTRPAHPVPLPSPPSPPPQRTHI